MKKVISMLLVVVMALSFATVAMAAQTQEEIDTKIATKEKLDKIVSDSISSYYDKIADSIADTVEQGADAILNDPEFIKKYVAPAVANIVITKLKDAGIENEELNQLITDTLIKVADKPEVNEIYKQFMSNEFVQAVKKRTIKYAIEDIMAQSGITEDKEATIAKISNYIWNAPAVQVAKNQPKLKSHMNSVALTLSLKSGINPSYYAADVKVSGRFIKNIDSVTVTGWNEPVITKYCQSQAVLLGLANGGDYLENMKTLDYEAIFKDAFKRALKDEVTERVNAIIEKIKAEVAEEVAETISEMKAEAIEEFVEALEEWFGVKVEIPADATCEEIRVIVAHAFGYDCPVLWTNK